MTFRRLRLFLLLGPLTFGACSAGSDGSTMPVRLVDLFDSAEVDGRVATGSSGPPRAEWRFASVSAGAGSLGGWSAGPGVTGLGIKDGLLIGSTADGYPVLHVERKSGLDDPDQIQSIEVRMRVSAGTNLALTTRVTDTVDLAREHRSMQRVNLWFAQAPIVPGPEMRTYRFDVSAPVTGSRTRHVLFRPTDVPGATFAIESLRLIFRNEHLAEMPSGVSWQGLRDIFHETVVLRASETARFRTTLPARPWFDVAIGTPEHGAVTFRLSIRRERDERDVTVMERTVTTPYRWERDRTDLSDFAGERVILSLAVRADRRDAVGFWGTPAVRHSSAHDRVASRGGRIPQGIILIQGDTLRIDHLDAYGYARKTAPTLTRLAKEGALFRNAIAQAAWTKASASSVMTSLYPSAHGVKGIMDRLPASAATLAEAYRQAGYETVSFASVPFTGQFTNLHQGFEELHEDASLPPGPQRTKSAREYVDRALDWLARHRDAPFFIFLHFFDPHSPYEPFPPYNTMWADAAKRDEHLRHQEAVRKVVTDPVMAGRGMATREEVLKAGVDPEAWLRYNRDWYDGSIRGMDAEIARLVERLHTLGLQDRTGIVFFGDHGEEFHDHGRMWHGDTVYGEMIRVPLIVRWPGAASGLVIQETVQLIDIMPTLLEMSGVDAPKGVQGQSMAPLLVPELRAGGAAAGWKPRPAVSEKSAQPDATEPPRTDESYAIIDGKWKLIHHLSRSPGRPEFELFDFIADPTDQRNVAADHPDVIKRMTTLLDRWRRNTAAGKLKSDRDATSNLSPAELQRLRSLGYIK